MLRCTNDAIALATLDAESSDPAVVFFFTWETKERQIPSP